MPPARPSSTSPPSTQLHLQSPNTERRNPTSFLSPSPHYFLSLTQPANPILTFTHSCPRGSARLPPRSPCNRTANYRCRERGRGGTHTLTRAQQRWQNQAKDGAHTLTNTRRGRQWLTRQEKETRIFFFGSLEKRKKTVIEEGKPTGFLQPLNALRRRSQTTTRR